MHALCPLRRGNLNRRRELNGHGSHLSRAVLLRALRQDGWLQINEAIGDNKNTRTSSRTVTQDIRRNDLLHHCTVEHDTRIAS